jgi:5-methylcytosine-specific restriction endonuclease McrA
MQKRKGFSPKVREEVFRKYDGHCAYCGKVLTTEDFQIDHLIPVARERFGQYTSEELETFKNYMPACRRCDHYKRAHSLETFRRYIEEIPEKLHDNYIYKVGLDYGLVSAHKQKVTFYFERLAEMESKVF